jgi:GTP:adenosylcobinamide-phosphate guanylyltransferase
VKIVRELAGTGRSPTYDGYAYQDKYVTKYFADNIPPKTPLVEEFEANLMADGDRITLAEYQETRSNPDLAVRRRAYDRFWTHPANMERLAKIQVAGLSPIKPNSAILEKLREMLHEPTKPVHPAEYYYSPDAAANEVQIGLDESIRHVENQLQVQIKRRWWLGSFMLHAANWWNGWELRKYVVARRSMPDRIEGEIMIRTTTALPATATPIMVGQTPLICINSIGGINYVHELTHAVHWSLVPFHTIPRDMIEIAPMCMENFVRKLNDKPLDPRDVTRQAALAIADMTATSPGEFNKIYADLCGLHSVGHVRARMWHATNVPGRYYQYALGTGAHNYGALAAAVRSADKDVIMRLIARLPRVR